MNQPWTDLQQDFLNRCEDIQVPKSVLNAAWHQVSKQNLTMIVFKKDTGDIHMWFKELPVTLEAWQWMVSE